MQVETFLFGRVEVDPERVIHFPEGISGFENDKRFMLIHESNGDDPVSFTLQSLDDPTVAFQIIDPAAIGFAYELELTDSETEKLGSPSPEEIAVMQILYKVEGKPIPIAPNIRGPLIINTAKRIGIQKILDRARQNIVISNLSSKV